LGHLPLSQKQGTALGVETGRRISPYLELCCLRVSANVSYANAESDVAMLTGMEVSSKTQQRLVQAYDFPEPEANSPIQEVGVDGGKVRLRTSLGEACVWRDYKAIATDQGIVATFQQNSRLISWINQQPFRLPLTCLGDGHDGVWNIISEIATPIERQEILDWYHLNENLQKVGGSLKRLKEAKALLWKGRVDETIVLFQGMKHKQAQNFCLYLEKHRHRIINYDYYQAEGICSIGSGAVESAIKQIDRRVQISGAQWKPENVPQVLAHRTAYLNGLFSLKG
jgi:hypothetical protein